MEKLSNTFEVESCIFEYYSKVEEYKWNVVIIETIENSYYNFSKKLCEFESRYDYNFKNLNSLYQDSVVVNIERLLVKLLNNNLLSDEILIGKLVEQICDRSILQKFCEAVQEMNETTEVMAGIASQISNSGSNTMMCGNLFTVAAYNTVASVFNNRRESLKNKKYTNKFDEMIFPYLFEALQELVTALYQNSLFQFETLRAYSIYKNEITFEFVNNAKNEVEAILSNLNLRTIPLEKNVELEKLKFLLKKYPFKAEIFIRIINLCDESDIEKKYQIIKVADKCLNGLKEYSEITKLDNKITFLKYQQGIKRISKDLKGEELENELRRVAEDTSIDKNYIALMELSEFKHIYSLVSKDDLQDDVKYELYKMYLEINKDEQLSVLKEKIQDFSNKYIGGYYLKLDIEIVGCPLICTSGNNIKENEELIKLGLNTVYNRNCDRATKIDILSNLRKNILISECRYFELEKYTFGEFISMTLEEKNNHQMRQEILEIYEHLEPRESYLKGYLKSRLDEKFTTERLLEGIEDEFLNIRDTPLICNADFGKSWGAKEGVVISERHLISCSKDRKEIIPFSSINNIKYNQIDSSGEIIIECWLQKKLHYIKLPKIGFYFNNDCKELVVLIYSIIKFSNQSVKLIVKDNVFDINVIDSKLELYIKSKEELQDNQIKRIIDEINLDDELDIMEKKQKIKQLECFGYIVEKWLQHINYLVDNKDIVQRTYNGILYNSREERDLAKKLDDEKIEHLNQLVNQVDKNNNEDVRLVIEKIKMLEYSPSIVDPYLEFLQKCLVENEKKEVFGTFNKLFNEAYNNIDELFNLKNAPVPTNNKDIISKVHNKLHNRINEIKKELESHTKLNNSKNIIISDTIKTIISCCVCVILGIVLYRSRASLFITIFYRFSWWKIILILSVIVGTVSYTFHNIKELIDGIKEYRNRVKRAKIARKKLKEYNKKYDFNTYSIK